MHARLRERPADLPSLQAAVVHALRELTGADRVPGVQIRLAASGTDVHRIAARLAGRGGPGAAAPVTALMAEPDETGSGIGAAVTHHGDGHGDDPRPVSVRLRHDDGTPRPAEAIDHDFALQSQRIVARGRRCLLVLIDVSKSGLIAPSPACAQRLQQALGERLVVLVDACQYRLGVESTGRYLAAGWMVALTGSKFVTGPAFCGALLLPPPWAEPRGRLQALVHPGLLLRWQAALTELRRFRAVSGAAVHGFLQCWGAAVAARIAADAHFQALPAPPLVRHGQDPADPPWDGLQTIFAFTLCRRVVPPTLLDRAQTARLHRRLQQGQAVHLGPPVAWGTRGGVAVSARRLGASARWGAGAAGDPIATQRAIDDAMAALDAAALLADGSAPAEAEAGQPHATVIAPRLDILECT